MRITIVPPRKAALRNSADDDRFLGGIETACLELSDALASRGHELSILGHPATRRLARGLNDAELEQTSGDALLVCNDMRLFNSGRFAQRILWVHNPLSFEKALRKGQMIPIWSKRPAAVFGSISSRDSFSPLFSFSSRTVIPLGVTHEFAGVTDQRSGPPRFAFVSQAQRGLKKTVEVFGHIVRPQRADAELHVFGSKPSDIGIDEVTARAMGVTFHPRSGKNDLAEFYAGTTALICVGAKDETFCLAAAEAQCAGVPVLTLGIGSLDERVSHGLNGLIANSFEELAQQAVALCADEELLVLLKAGAIKQRGAFTWARSAKLWEILLASGERSAHRLHNISSPDREALPQVARAADHIAIFKP
jgi:glycosyltransferase involved in cell wall biosynthesis